LSVGCIHQVCRAAGYHEQALFVAGAAGEPAVYLDVLLTDCSTFDEALTYLEGLPRAAAADALKKYGKVRKVTPRPGVVLRCSRLSDKKGAAC
jgi:hypothetical protein